jgi:hypothetical protein
VLKLSIDYYSAIARYHKPDDNGVTTQLSYEVNAAPSWQDYRQLVQRCSDAAEPLTSQLFACGFEAAILLVGAAFNAESGQKYPHRRLARPLEETEIQIISRIEKTILLEPDMERTVGLYVISPSQISEVLWFVAQTSWSMLILSKRQVFSSNAFLKKLYESVAPEHNKVFLQLDEHHLSQSICRYGDIVVRPRGAFDDKWRLIRFLYDGRNARLHQMVEQSIPKSHLTGLTHEAEIEMIQGEIHRAGDA